MARAAGGRSEVCEQFKVSQVNVAICTAVQGGLVRWTLSTCRGQRRVQDKNYGEVWGRVPKRGAVEAVNWPRQIGESRGHFGRNVLRRSMAAVVGDYSSDTKSDCSN